MKIILFIDSFRIGGGAERQFAGLACMLAQAGHQVHAVAYWPYQGYQSAMARAGVSIHQEDWGSSRLQKLRGARSLFSRINPEAVISYKNGPNSIACTLKALGAKWRLIVSDRNTTQDISLSVKLQYRLYSRADFIVPNSFSQARFIEYNFPKLSPKLRVITNFTDTDFFSPAPEPKDPRLQPNPMRILSLGRITPQKNLLNYIRAARIVIDQTTSPVEFHWYGRQQSPKYAADCQQLIRELNLGGNFFIHPQSDDPVAVYRSADIFCLPSIFEGFPNVLCEAMACQLPAAASDVCDNPDIIDNFRTGCLFNPETPDLIAQALIGLIMMQPKYRLEMGRAARNAIIENCSKQAFLQKYLKLLS